MAASGRLPALSFLIASDRFLGQAMKALQEHVGRWPPTSAFVALDTSFYIEHEGKLEEADFRSLLGLPGMPVHVLMPIVVVDELPRSLS
jgi:hypothetical protein